MGLVMSLKSLRAARVVLISFLLTSVQGLSRGDWTQFGVRPLAMGNAFVAVADDYNALFYNPAGLARLTEWNVEIINPRFDFALKTYSLIQELAKKKKGMGTSEAIDLIKKQTGIQHYLGIGINPYVVAPHWGVAIGNRNYLSFVTHQKISIGTDAAAGLLIPVGIAGNFLNNQLSLGASLKYQGSVGINQETNIDSIPTLTSSKDNSSDQKIDKLLTQGCGLGVDLGLLFTPEQKNEPTLGISIMDFGGTKMSKFASKGALASTIPPTVNTGISIKPIKTESTYLLLAADTQMINQNSHFSKKLNLGMEWGFSKIIKIEAGLMTGYLTGGFQFDVGLLKVRLATYVVDGGPIVGLAPELASRRVAIQVNLII